MPPKQALTALIDISEQPQLELREPTILIKASLSNMSVRMVEVPGIYIEHNKRTKLVRLVECKKIELVADRYNESIKVVAQRINKPELEGKLVFPSFDQLPKLSGWVTYLSIYKDSPRYMIL